MNNQLKETITKAHQEDLEAIETYFNLEKDYDQEFVKLINILVKTERNPYSYLTGWSTNWTLESSCCHNFLQQLHHALVYDGEVCFTSIIGGGGGSPRLLFADKWYMEETESDYSKKMYKEIKMYTYIKDDIIEYHYDVDRFIKDFIATERKE